MAVVVECYHCEMGFHVHVQVGVVDGVQQYLVLEPVLGLTVAPVPWTMVVVVAAVAVEVAAEVHEVVVLHVNKMKGSSF